MRARELARGLAAAAAFVLLSGGCGDDDQPQGPDGGPGPDGEAPSTTPGSPLSMRIAAAGLDEGGRPFVEYRITDATGAALPRAGFETSWTLAVFAPDPVTGATHWRSLITREASGALGTTRQPAAEQGGTYAELGEGLTRYVFPEPLAADADRQATYRVAAWASRPSAADPDEEEVVNGVHDFVPAGGSPQPADVVSNEACNGCHMPLEAHGGVRRDVRLCTNCHTPELFDPDTEAPSEPGQMNLLDMNTMVHRIHAGVALPTLQAAREQGLAGVRYHVIGFRGSDHVYGETLPDGPDEDTLPELEGVEYPQDLRVCETCHRAGPEAPLAGRWQTASAAGTCGSCHDATWFGPADAVPPLHHPHPGGPVEDDARCATCHPATGPEFDLSVAGAHTLPARASGARGLDLELVSVEGAAGENPVVTFRVSDATGAPVPLAELDLVALTVAGPTEEYTVRNVVRQDAREATANPDGSWTYRFAPRAASDAHDPGGPVIPADAAGSFAVSLEGRREVELRPGVTIEEGGDNPVLVFPLEAGAEARPRREVVSLEKCDRCHLELRAHGNLRREIEYCVMCHTADATDWNQRPKGAAGDVALAETRDGLEERSVRFSRMIHLIHTGEALEIDRPYVIYGFMGSVHDFGGVRFPGDRAACEGCHLEGTYGLEAAAASPPTLANETDRVLHAGSAAHAPGEPSAPPVQSTCLACHNTPGAYAHAALNTLASGLESCDVCHGAGRDAAVEKVHR